jgi:hypothetical protein
LKKQFLAIAFLFVLIAPLATMFLYLQFEKASIKREIKWKMIAGMDHEELVLLKFSKEETQTKLRWEHSKEFEYNGQMYDVVSKEIKGDSIFYRCWWDHAETALNKKLQKLVAKAFNNDENKQRNQKQLNVFFQSFFCVSLFDWQASLSEILVKNYNYTNYQNTFSPIQESPPTPPPRLS